MRRPTVRAVAAHRAIALLALALAWTEAPAQTTDEARRALAAVDGYLDLQDGRLEAARAAGAAARLDLGHALDALRAARDSVADADAALASARREAAEARLEGAALRADTASLGGRLARAVRDLDGERGRAAAAAALALAAADTTVQRLPEIRADYARARTDAGPLDPAVLDALAAALDALRRAAAALAPTQAATAGPDGPPLPRPAPGLVALPRPFGDLYGGAADRMDAVYDLALVRGPDGPAGVDAARVYLAHGGTHSPRSVRPLYWDLRAERWATDTTAGGAPVLLYQEGTTLAEVGPTGRLYANARDATGRAENAVHRRRTDGTWERIRVQRADGHSYHTAEWLDPVTGDTVVVHDAELTPHFPSAAVSADDGRTWRVHGAEPDVDADGRETGLEGAFHPYYLAFRGDLWLFSYDTGRPWASRYTRDPDRPFEPVLDLARDGAPALRSGASVVTKGLVLRGPDGADAAVLLLLGTDVLYGPDVAAGALRPLELPGRARDATAAPGGGAFVLVDDGGGSALRHVAADGAVTAVAGVPDRFPVRFRAVEHVPEQGPRGTFYLGGGDPPTLWRYVPAADGPEAAD